MRCVNAVRLSGSPRFASRAGRALPSSSNEHEESSSMSVHAVVLMQCETDEIPEAAQVIADIDGVSEVYSVAGEFDLVAVVRVPNHEDLSKVIPGGIAKVEGVVRTETLIAFQVFSKHDLERLFSI